MIMEDPRKFHIKDFKIIKDFVIEIHFEDGKIQTIDFSKIQYPDWWSELEDIDYFNKVSIFLDNLTWPHGQDFKPEHLYYWEKFKKYYIPEDLDI